MAGNDYAPTSGFLTFNPGGPLSQVVSVPVIDDGQDDGVAIDFSLAVTNTGTGEAGQVGQAVIIDNDGPTPVAANVGANVGDAKVVEGDDTNRAAWVSIRLDQPATVSTSFAYHTVDGTATAGSKDYKAESGVVTFNPGQVERSINITVQPDTVNEGDEQFSVEVTNLLGSPGLGDTTGVVTIIDDDDPTAPGYVVSVGDAETYEGNAGIGQVNIPITINKKRPKGAPDEDVEIALDVVYGGGPGFVSPTDVNVKDPSTTVTLSGGVTKTFRFRSAVTPSWRVTRSSRWWPRRRPTRQGR